MVNCGVFQSKGAPNAMAKKCEIAGTDYSVSRRTRCLRSSMAPFTISREAMSSTRLIMEGVPSEFDALDHPSFVVFGKGAQNLGKLVTIFLLRLHGDLYLHN